MEKKNDIKIMLKEAAILLVITVTSGLILGFVHELTRENIEKQELLAIESACREVFSQAERFEEMDYFPSDKLKKSLSENGVSIGKVYLASGRGGEFLGYIVESASSEGYSGTIDLYTGVTAEGRLNGVSILEINETVGLGMEAGNVLVPQFSDKKAQIFSFTKTGSTSDSEIDAISGATRTTKAVVNAVNGAIMAADELMEGGVLGE